MTITELMESLPSVDHAFECGGVLRLAQVERYLDHLMIRYRPWLDLLQEHGFCRWKECLNDEGDVPVDEVFLGPNVVFTNDHMPRSAFKKSADDFLPTLVEVGATIGANATVVCGTTIGAYAFVGGGTTVTKDVLPFSKTVAARGTHAYGLNAVGLERRGFSKGRIRKIHHAYKTLLASKLNTTQALEKLKSEPDRGEDADMLIRFIEQSERGVIK